MAQTAQQNLQAALLLATQALAAVDAVIANPTQANVDAAVAAVNGGALSQTVIARPTQSQDGESYDWNGLRRALVDQVERLPRMIQLLGGPYLVTSRARP